MWSVQEDTESQDLVPGSTKIRIKEVNFPKLPPLFWRRVFLWRTSASTLTKTDANHKLCQRLFLQFGPLGTLDQLDASGYLLDCPKVSKVSKCPKYPSKKLPVALCCKEQRSFSSPNNYATCANLWSIYLVSDSQISSILFLFLSSAFT
jgi:hypothetical protein